MASLVVGAVGSAIGGTFFAAGAFGMSGAALGWSIGSFLGGQLFGAQGQDVQGPRLSDLNVQSSAYGAPIPILYGTARFAGNVIWALPINETRNKESAGGKGGGGGSVTTYSYDATFAVGLCEGEITGIRRIWADAKLIYDVGDTANLETVTASNRAIDGITVHTGSETQEADPIIQADKGVANTQAFRGLAYIVFDSLQLKDFGNRIPNISVEALKTASSTTRRLDTIAIPELLEPTSRVRHTATHMDGDGTIYIFMADDTINPKYVQGYKLYVNGLIEPWVYLDSTFYTFFYNVPGYGDRVCYHVGNQPSTNQHRVFTFKDDLIDQVAHFSNPMFVLNVSGLLAQNSSFVILGDYIYFMTTDNANPVSAILKGSITEGEQSRLLGGSKSLTVLNDSNSDVNVDLRDFDVVDGVIYCLNADDTIDKFTTDGVFISTINFDSSSFWTWDPDRGIGSNPLIRVVDDIIWLIHTNGVYKIEDGVLSKLGPALTQYGYIPTENPGGTWVKDGVVHYYRTFGVGESPSIADGFYWPFLASSLSSGATTLDVIQTDICTRAGLESSDIDVTELTDTVEGYTIARPMSARAATEPLQKAFLFDAAEIDNVLTFVKRGGASAVSIPEIDLGAAPYGSTAPLITHTRQQDAELPSKVIANYIDIDMDYQQGSQKAQRINANVENVIVIELAIAMTGDYAKQLAEILLTNSWIERDKFNISLTTEYIQRNPTNVITVTANGDTRIMRITSINYGSVISAECVSEDLQVYSSDAVAGGEGFTAQIVGLDGPTKMELLDIPILRNQDDDLGLYVAVTGLFAGWTGAQIFKSLDGGTSYSPFDSVLNASTMGSSTDILADGVTTLWDRTSTVTVTLTNGTLSSDTEANVLNGTNYAVLGSELIQFVNATLNGDGTYTLDTLLRGRRGTEWATSTHAVDDKFVFLDIETITRIDAQLNVERDYKPVTIGTFVDEATNVPFTNTGISLKPFSPSFVKAARDGSNDITYTWLRRSRYIGAPLWHQPLIEDSESYEIDVMDGSTVKRTISSSTETASYTAAQQTADGFTPGDLITIRIYQLSAAIGRGYKREETI